MKTYLVVWEIDIEANSPHEAARKARENEWVFCMDKYNELEAATEETTP